MTIYQLNIRQAKRYNELYDNYKTLCKFKEIPQEKILNYSEFFDEILERGYENIVGFLKKGHIPQKRKK